MKNTSFLRSIATSFTLLYSLSLCLIPVTYAADWVAVGSNIASTNTTAMDIATDSTGVPFIIYKDNDNSGSGSVKKYVNGSWSNVGDPGFTGQTTFWTQIEVDSTDKLWVLSSDSSGNLSFATSNDQISWSGWSSIPTPSYASQPSFKLNGTDQPYIVYQDGSLGGKISVQTYVDMGGFNQWQSVGGLGFSANGITSQPQIAFDSTNSPYVLYTEASNGTQYLKKFDGSNWIAMSLPTDITSGTIASMNIDSENNIVLVYTSTSYGGKATAQMWDGTAWSVIGQNPFNTNSIGGFSPIIKFDTSDSPYVSFLENSKLVVMKYNSDAWEYYGDDGDDIAATSALFAFDLYATDATAYVSHTTLSGSSINVSVVSDISLDPCAAGSGSGSGETTGCQQITGGGLSIAAPSNIAFNAITTAATSQINTVTFAQPISVTDLRDSTAGFSATMTTTNFADGSNQIPYTNLSFQSSAVSSTVGSVLTGVTASQPAFASFVTDTSTTSNPMSIIVGSSIQRSPGVWDIIPTLKLQVDAFTNPGSYQAMMTLTVT